MKFAQTHQTASLEGIDDPNLSGRNSLLLLLIRLRKLLNRVIDNHQAILKPHMLERLVYLS